MQQNLGIELYITQHNFDENKSEILQLKKETEGILKEIIS